MIDGWGVCIPCWSLDSTPSTNSDSSFLMMHTVEATRDGSRVGCLPFPQETVAEFRVDEFGLFQPSHRCGRHVGSELIENKSPNLSFSVFLSVTINTHTPPNTCTITFQIKEK